jgi:hypothetical protein
MVKARKSQNGNGARRAKTPPPQKPAELPTEVAFEFIKSNLFRVIAVDGIFGGLSPQGRSIHMAVFSERRPLPRRTVHGVTSGGGLGDELLDRREGRQAFAVREVEADLVMDLMTAQQLHMWLAEKIDQLRESLAASGVLRQEEEKKNA